jgi:hypothetical protein
VAAILPHPKFKAPTGFINIICAKNIAILKELPLFLRRNRFYS